MPINLRHAELWDSDQPMNPVSPGWGHWTHAKLHPLKGDYGGECQRLACSNGRAHWYNQTNEKYYCNDCARAFNDVCARNGQPPLLVLQPGPPPPER